MRKIVDPICLVEDDENVEGKQELFSRLEQAILFMKQLQTSSLQQIDEDKIQQLEDALADLETGLDFRRWLAEQVRSWCAVKRGRGRRKLTGGRIIQQPPMDSLIRDILREKKESLGVLDITNALVQEKGYVSQAKDLKGQVRILLYKNHKGWFIKTEPGKFSIAS